ncbi:hypothetical protein [Legionella shakespearei]|uniref:Transmembrane protein n=1 Tax=Legionella shakespearei DSM 23087 TaxID=1122169 RepID=A0A0W0YKV0_9GAMM|nr:hypothetical protein [Legionella shakespearei]KTD57528.1 hypothetical protein Lsha_2369 [Legionella shakespearei DSM 23087]
MWDKIKDWYHRNKSYLVTLLLASLGVGLGTACICLAFPAALPVFASISLLGLIPLAFLDTIPFALAVLALSAIMVAVSFAAVAVSIVVLKQLASISINLYELVSGEGETSEVPLESSHDYLRRHLQVESSSLRRPDSDNEFDEISSDEMRPTPNLLTPAPTSPADDGHAEPGVSSLSFS